MTDEKGGDEISIYDCFSRQMYTEEVWVSVLFWRNALVLEMQHLNQISLFERNRFWVTTEELEMFFAWFHQVVCWSDDDPTLLRRLRFHSRVQDFYLFNKGFAVAAAVRCCRLLVVIDFMADSTLLFPHTSQKCCCCCCCTIGMEWKLFSRDASSHRFILLKTAVLCPVLKCPGIHLQKA